MQPSVKEEWMVLIGGFPRARTGPSTVSALNPRSLLSRRSHDCWRGQAAGAEVRLLYLSLSSPCPSPSACLHGSHSVSHSTFCLRIWLFSFLPLGLFLCWPPAILPQAPVPPSLSHLGSLFLISAFLCLPLLLNSQMSPSLIHRSSLSPPPNTDSRIKYVRCGLRKEDLKANFREQQLSSSKGKVSLSNVSN